MKDDSQSRSETSTGPMSFAELMMLSLAFNGRVDTLWQRVLYTHAAIVGVMVFFATTEHAYMTSRILVFFFYTLNLAITMSALLESYTGLKAALEDLKAMSGSSDQSNMQVWVMARSYHRHAARRIAALAIVWAVLAYLLFSPVNFAMVG